MRARELLQILLGAYGPQGWWPAETREEMAIGAILTQNTSWKNVEKALENLRRVGLLSMESLRKTPVERIEELIRPAGFRRKAEYLKNLAEAWDEETMEKMGTEELRDYLLSIKGVGEETADSILLYGFNRPVFVVDAYTRRILSRLMGLEGDENIREWAKDLSVEELQELHALLVEHGKRFCRKRPLCDKCVLRERCRYYHEVSCLRKASENRVR